MKKLITLSLGLALFTVFFSTLTFAQTTQGLAQTQGFVDNDKNGVCDNYQNGKNGQGRNFIDNDNDGICDRANYRSGGRGQGRNFRDANGDGVCDNKQGNTSCRKRGYGRGNGCCGNGYRGQGYRGNGCRGARY